MADPLKQKSPTPEEPNVSGKEQEEEEGVGKSDYIAMLLSGYLMIGVPIFLILAAMAAVILLLFT